MSGIKTQGLINFTIKTYVVFFSNYINQAITQINHKAPGSNNVSLLAND